MVSLRRTRPTAAERRAGEGETALAAPVIEIFSDPICPWCMIGKRRLDRALSAASQDDPQSNPVLAWRVFQLNPAMPREGMDRVAYLAAKFGGAQRAREVYRVIEAEGRSEGIDFSFDRIRRTPNTLAAHGLIRVAARQGLASAMAERLFVAYFSEGRDIGEASVLAGLADEVGLEGDSAAFLRENIPEDELRAEDAAARAAGIAAVPFFVIDGRFSVSGAVAPEVFTRALELARESG